MTESSLVHLLDTCLPTGQARPVVVLVHGAWADASSWSGEVATLQAAGYDVRAIANPLQDLTTDSQYVADYLKTIPGPVVLVGHSYGGAVITNAAAGLANVKALVYVDAAAPAPGETNGQLSGASSILTKGHPRPAVLHHQLPGDTGRRVRAVPERRHLRPLFRQRPAPRRGRAALGVSARRLHRRVRHPV